MREEQLGGLRTRVTGGTDGKGGGRGPLVLLLHGFGAPGDDLCVAGRRLECADRDEVCLSRKARSR